MKVIYRPFTWNDRGFLRGKWVRHKVCQYENQITGVYLDGDIMSISIDGTPFDAKRVLRYFTFLDGSPCGKVV